MTIGRLWGTLIPWLMGAYTSHLMGLIEQRDVYFAAMGAIGFVVTVTIVHGLKEVKP
jgi:hypothetical protein